MLAELELVSASIRAMCEGGGGGGGGGGSGGGGQGRATVREREGHGQVGAAVSARWSEVKAAEAGTDEGTEAGVAYLEDLDSGLDSGLDPHAWVQQQVQLLVVELGLHKCI